MRISSLIAASTLSWTPRSMAGDQHGRRIYRARVALELPGRRGVAAHAELDGRVRRGRAVLDVSDDPGTPALGSIVPGGATPTMRDARCPQPDASHQLRPGAAHRVLYMVSG